MSGRQSRTHGSQADEEARSVGFDAASLKDITKRELCMRFALGAGISLAAAIAGLVAGRRFGGLFLAFPAILPASLTLVSAKEGRSRASINAVGATIGAVALFAFAVVAATLIRGLGAVAVLLATAAWVAVAVGIYAAVRLVERLTGKFVVAGGAVRRAGGGEAAN